MKPILRELISGGAASGFFLALSASTPLGFLPLLGLACAVYFGTRLILPSPKGPPPVPEGAAGPRPEIARLANGARRFHALASSVAHAETAENLRRVARAVENLAQQLEREPDALLNAGDLLTLHLPSALSLVERHVDLAGRPHLDDGARRELEESRGTIGVIAEAFEAQYVKLLERDVQELRVDRMVFEELLRLDDHGRLQAVPRSETKERI